MNTHKINDCINILTQLLKPESVLSYSDRKELLNFFVEEKTKSIVIYDTSLQEKTQQVLSAIKTKKDALASSEQYDELARIRDLEKSFVTIIQGTEELKQNNRSASFQYGADGLSLIITEGEYPHTIQELERMGLHLIFFSQVLDKLNMAI